MPDEPVPDDAAGLRAATARLRAVVEAKGEQVAMLTAALDAALERERRLELRLAEVERRQEIQHSLKEIQYHPRLIEGCLAGTGLTLDQTENPTDIMN